jgi:hypothetical protein
MDELLMKRYPWMDALMVQTLIKLEEEGKLQPLLESMSNDSGIEDPVRIEDPPAPYLERDVRRHHWREK